MAIALKDYGDVATLTSQRMRLFLQFPALSLPPLYRVSVLWIRILLPLSCQIGNIAVIFTVDDVNIAAALRLVLRKKFDI
jgi:hypothetical protein